MLQAIALLVICGTSRQAIATGWDGYFGTVDYNFRTAGLLWAYYLVDPWMQDNTVIRYTGRGFVKDARACLQDLLTRMDRPIVGGIAKGNWNPRPGNERDDFAAGIAFWTLEWKSDATQQGSHWERLREKAEEFLLKASHEGDPVQQSYASLAYAYCPWRCYADELGAYLPGPEGALTPVPIPSGAWSRLGVLQARLIDTYSRCRNSVPERALRAASQLASLADCERKSEEEHRWRAAISSDFKNLRSWHGFRTGG